MRGKQPVIGMAVGPAPKLLAGKHVFNTPYLHAVECSGGVPLLLPATEQPGAAETYIDLIDGLLLPGGVDVTPALYGQDPVPQVTYLLEDLDRLELALVRLAVEKGKPILGICRGMQLVNVAFGGTLYQDLPSQYPGCLGHSQDASTRSQRTHRVKLTPDSVIGSLLGTEMISVNSYHHQAVKDAAPGFTVTARALDGVVEAIEDPRRKVLAVQWHPEELVDRYPVFRALFRHLVEEAADACAR